MKPEWFLFLLFLLCGAAIVLKSRSGFNKLVWIGVGIIFTATVLAARQWDKRLHARASVRQNLAAILPREDRPDGYVSSRKCQACHPDQYSSWHRTFHRTMTQFASPQTVLGDFENRQLELDGETYILSAKDGNYYVDMVDPVWRENQRISRKDLGDSAERARIFNAGPRRQVKIGLLTGSHNMQVYWLAAERGNMQMVFPFAWLISEKRWVPFHQTFLRDPNMPVGTAVWNYVCIRCHATGGQPRDVEHTDGYDSRTAELGIACEACHGPAETHITLNSLPARRYKLHVAGQGDPSIINPARLSSKRASEVCGQCHGIRWTTNNEELAHTGFTFRPGQRLADTTTIVQPSKPESQPWVTQWLAGNQKFLPDRFWSDGEVRVSGRDFNGLIDSPCYQKGDLSCLSCHSLHRSNPDDQLGSGMEGNAACIQCHKIFRQNIDQHTHHKTNSSGSLCYNCHMPHTTYGLLKNIRSHRISSPAVETAVQTGRPTACNLCHLDRTLQWSADYLSLWYQQPKPQLDSEQKTISSAILLTLSGDAGQRALMAWHMGWEPAKQVSGEDWLAPYLAQLLDDPYSAVRYIAARSASSLRGVGSSTGQSDKQRLMNIWSSGTGLTFKRPRPELLVIGPGKLDVSAFEQILQKRDHRSMDLQE